MHESVLLKEIIDGLAITLGDVVVDNTVNGGGMSEEILRRFKDSITLICIDRDKSALEKAEEKLGKRKNIHFVEGNFRDIKKHLEPLGIRKIDRALFDLGLSSNQLENSGRGFSFKRDEPLLMTFEVNREETAFTAHDIVNKWEGENIETILTTYGEERKAKRIVGAILKAREEKAINTSGELADIIEKAIGRHGRIHPATKTFQALRITVNDELQSIKEGLTETFSLLEPHGRIAVISFHSLEDRIVKHFFKDRSKEQEAILINKKPIVPSDSEMKQNPRSRSAKLRIIEKVA